MIFHHMHYIKHKLGLEIWGLFLLLFLLPFAACHQLNNPKLEPAFGSDARIATTEQPKVSTEEAKVDEFQAYEGAVVGYNHCIWFSSITWIKWTNDTTLEEGGPWSNR